MQSLVQHTYTLSLFSLAPDYAWRFVVSFVRQAVFVAFSPQTFWHRYRSLKIRNGNPPLEAIPHLRAWIRMFGFTICICGCQPQLIPQAQAAGTVSRLTACVFRLGFLRSDNDAKPLRRTKRQVRDCCFIAWKRKHKKAQVNKHKKTQESARKHAMKCAPVIIATAD